MTSKLKMESRKNNYNNFTLGNLITVSVIVIFIGVIIGLSIDSKSSQSTNPAPVAQTVFAGNTLKVAKGFACSCGTCGEKNLAVCECGTATNTKNFIEGNLQSGMPEGEVVELVKEYYGHFVGDNPLKSVYE